MLLFQFNMFGVKLYEIGLQCVFILTLNVISFSEFE